MVIACLALALALGGSGYAAFVLAPNSVGTKQLKNRAVTPAKIGPPEKWHEVGAVGEPRFFDRLTPEVGIPISNWGGPYNTAGFAKDQGGLVRLKGIVRFERNGGATCGSWSLFRLPRGYRPAKREALAGLNHTAAMRIDVLPDGWVTLCVGVDLVSPAAITLDGLTFRPVAAPPERRGAPTARITPPGMTFFDANRYVFEALDSNDDGKIVKYEWDLDGNGSFETNAGKSIYQEWTAFEVPACDPPVSTTIRLRVTDNTGRRNVATRAIQVHDMEC